MNLLLPNILEVALFEFIEYVVHFGLHALDSPRHQDHHRSKELESVPVFILPFVFLRFGHYGFAAGAWGYLISHRAGHKSNFFSHHRAHHADPRYNFGVTTPFFDHVFGTYKASRR